jgi:acyl-CoA synthetase (AMP-forming)/AMP-acid ligase II
MISHRNVIANTLQIQAFERNHREAKQPKDGNSVYSEVSLGLLPQSHIYALVVICHAGAYRGDQIIVLPKFELKSYLASIQKFKITSLFLVCFGPSPVFSNRSSRSGSSYYHQHAAQPGRLFKV